MWQRVSLQSEYSWVKYGEHHNKTVYNYRKQQLFVTDPDQIQMEDVKAN